MGSPDIKENIPPSKKDISENNSDKLNFLNDSKFTDIKEPLSKTIDTLAKENIVTPKEKFWNNIQQVTEKMFSDPRVDFDTEFKNEQAENIFLFRQEFQNINKQDIHTKKQEVNTE
ncbi:TPA: hypothetical protein DCZ39_00755, partial [Patescibacteria group bacterium]|nr:hypothetical protein [Candidatus Gracilibacteria bacterium]